MALEIVSSKVSGTPSSASWVWIHEITPPDPQTLAGRGRLLVVVTIKDRVGGVDGASRGREIVNSFQSHYYASHRESAYEALKVSAEAITLDLSHQTQIKVDVGAVSMVEGVMYVTAIGSVKAMVYRNRSLATILTGGENAPSVVSGYPQKGDLFLVGTEAFFDQYPGGKIASYLDLESPALIAEHLLSEIRQLDASSEMGVAIMAFQEVGQVKESIEESKAELPLVKPRRLNLFNNRLNRLFTNLTHKLPSRRIYVHENLEMEAVKSRNHLLSVGVMLLVILLVSIGFGIKQSRLKRLKGQYQEKLNTAQTNLDQAVKLFSTDEQAARGLFNDSLNSYEQISAFQDKDKEITNLKQELDKYRATILGEYLADSQLLVDLSLLTSGFSAQKLSASEGKMAILDTVGKKLVTVEIPSKRSQAVAGGEMLTGAKQAAIYADRLFVLKDDGVYEVDQEAKKVAETAWGGETLFSVYSGNLYVVDLRSSTVLRFPGGTGGFGAKQSWLAPGINLDLSQVTTLTIDGSLWLGNRGGKIWKLSQGSPENLEKLNPSPPLGEITALYTNEALNWVYLLDKTNSRIVVFDKKGLYKAQYTAEILKNASDLVVSEKDKMAVVLVGGDKLYSVELKHL